MLIVCVYYKIKSINKPILNIIVLEMQSVKEIVVMVVDHSMVSEANHN